MLEQGWFCLHQTPRTLGGMLQSRRKLPRQVLSACRAGDQDHGAEGRSAGFPLSHPLWLEGWGGGLTFGEGTPNYCCLGNMGWWKERLLSHWVFSLRLQEGTCWDQRSQRIGYPVLSDPFINSSGSTCVFMYSRVCLSSVIQASVAEIRSYPWCLLITLKFPGGTCPLVLQTIGRAILFFTTGLI